MNKVDKKSGTVGSDEKPKPAREVAVVGDAFGPLFRRARPAGKRD
jgi:hypothetical protein